MVVLAASIITKSGKPLVSRQFVDMSRSQIESYIAAFSRLVGTGKQHTFIETVNVRYVYQPVESLYLLLLTNKQSNILEDLETLRLLSKLVPEYTYSLDEEGICKTAFEHICAFDEAVSRGYKENVTLSQVKQYCEMDSHEEQLHKIDHKTKVERANDIMKKKSAEIAKIKSEKSRSGSFVPSMGRIDTGFVSDSSILSGGRGQSDFGISSNVDSNSTKSKGTGMKLIKSRKTNQLLESLEAEGEIIVEDVRQTVGRSNLAAPPPADPITFTIEEKVNATMKKDGGISSFDVQGTLYLQLLNQDDGQIQVEVETNPSVAFSVHPNINKELFKKENILAPKDASRPFRANQPGSGLTLLKWRKQISNDSLVPLTINCWPSVSGNETYVNIEYEAFSQFDLQNIVISVPLPTLRDGKVPSVRQIDGEWRYDSRNHVLEWSIDLIDNSNRSGCMEFVVPAADPEVFFPISVRFTATNTFGGLKVVNILPQRSGLAPKYSERTTLSTDSYQVV